MSFCLMGYPFYFLYIFFCFVDGKFLLVVFIVGFENSYPNCERFHSVQHI